MITRNDVKIIAKQIDKLNNDGMVMPELENVVVANIIKAYEVDEDIAQYAFFEAMDWAAS